MTAIKACVFGSIILIFPFGCTRPSMDVRNQTAEDDEVARCTDRIHQITGWNEFHVKLVDENESGREFLVTQLPGVSEGYRSFFVDRDGTVTHEDVP